MRTSLKQKADFFSSEAGSISSGEHYENIYMRMCEHLRARFRHLTCEFCAFEPLIC